MNTINLGGTRRRHIVRTDGISQQSKPGPEKNCKSSLLKEISLKTIDDEDTQKAVLLVDDDILNDTVDRVTQDFDMAYDMLENFCGTASLNTALGEAMDYNRKSRDTSAWRMKMFGYLATFVFGVFFYYVIKSKWSTTK